MVIEYLKKRLKIVIRILLCAHTHTIIHNFKIKIMFSTQDFSSKNVSNSVCVCVCVRTRACNKVCVTVFILFFFLRYSITLESQKCSQLPRSQIMNYR